jgi:hypothetical protein
MNLGDPVGVEAQAICELGLFHELSQAGGRRGTLGTLNFGEEAEFHGLPVP